MIALLTVIVAIPLLVGAIVFISIPSILVRSWAVVTLWRWFAVPALGLPALGYAATIGLLLLAEMVSFESATYKEHKIDYKTTLIVRFVGPVVFVGLGWLVRRWM